MQTRLKEGRERRGYSLRGKTLTLAREGAGRRLQRWKIGSLNKILAKDQSRPRLNAYLEANTVITSADSVTLLMRARA